jgi:hypothetical protein
MADRTGTFERYAFDSVYAVLERVMHAETLSLREIKKRLMMLGLFKACDDVLNGDSLDVEFVVKTALKEGILYHVGDGKYRLLEVSL